MSHEAKKAGKQAEQRVVEAALRLGYNARFATLDEDCGGGKTDVVINGRDVQVSVQPKSREQRKSLEKKGVVNVAAGGQVDDASLAVALSSLFRG
jgi:hypothetical protein